jgi:polysaccharide biosynthesis transport protein
MTPHQSVLAQILASFEDEREIEALPIEAVQADLHVLGFDPAASIALATRLASTSRSPVARRQPGDAADADVSLPAAGALAEEKRTEQLPLSGEQAKVHHGHHWHIRFRNILGGRRARTGPVLGLRIAIAACIPLLFVAGAVIYVSRVPPTFEAQALVMLNEGERRPVPTIEGVVPGVVPNEERLQGQVLLICSRGMAERLVNELNLHLLPEFNSAIRPKTSSLSSLLDPTRLIPPAVFESIPRSWAEAMMKATSPIEMTDQQQAELLRAEIIENVLRKIRAEPANRSTVLTLKFESVDPSLAALGANKLAELYLAEQLESKQSVSQQNRTFLEAEITSLRQDVAVKEQAIQNFRREHGLLERTGERSGTLVHATELGIREVAVRAQLQAAEARLRQIESLLADDADLESATRLLGSPILAALLARQLEIYRQVRDVSRNADERHPRMVSLRAEQNEIQERKRLEIQQIAQRQRNEIQVLRNEQASLRESIRGRERGFQERGEHVVELERLEREAQAQRDLLGTYLDRLQEIASLERAQQPDARIISRAVLPDQPSYPQRGLIFGLALLIGTVMATGWTMLPRRPDSGATLAAAQEPSERTRSSSPGI